MARTADKTDIPRRLTAAGHELFTRCGYHATGIQQITDQAGVPKGSFYYYFRSKEAFGVALLERYFARFLQDVALQLNQTEGTPRERLLNHFRAAVDLFVQQVSPDYPHDRDGRALRQG